MNKVLFLNLAKLVYEFGQLRRVPHEGFKLLGIKLPHSVAEHSLRAAQIAYILAVLEGHENPEKICSMVVFHDLTETRLGDLHKVARRYISQANHELAIQEQTQDLEAAGAGIRALWMEVEQKETRDAIIAKDADNLEMAFSAKEQLEQGHKDAQDWIDNVEKALQTKSAKALFRSMLKVSATDWWKGLKKLK